MKLRLFALVLSLCHLSMGENVRSADIRTKNYERLYQIGKESYLANDWKNCILYMESAIEDHRKYHEVVTGCKIKCHNGKRRRNATADDIDFYESMVRQTLCLLQCKREGFGKNRVEQVSSETVYDFDEREPYHYLQLCYYNNDQAQQAASAAFTYLIAHPDHEVMRTNLKFYLQDGAEEDQLVDFEAQSFVNEFLRGTDYYREENWHKVATSMEKALELYLKAEEECKFQCDKPFDMGWFPDFTTSVANHFTYCLRCKRRCQEKLSNLHGEKLENFIALMYHYLQMSYYKMGDLWRATKCVGSHLILNPNNEEMLQNKKYYLSNHPELDEKEAFEPRVEALEYAEKREQEVKLLEFIDASFKDFFDKQDVDEDKKLPRLTIEAIDVDHIMKVTNKQSREEL